MLELKWEVVFPFPPFLGRCFVAFILLFGCFAPERIWDIILPDS